MLFGPKEACMLAFSRRMALALIACAALLPVLGLLSARPAAADICTGGGVGGCSEIITIDQSGSGFGFQFTPQSNPAFNSNGYMIGIVNNTGTAIQDVQLNGNLIFNVVGSETLLAANNPNWATIIGNTAHAPLNNVNYTIYGEEGLLSNGNLLYVIPNGLSQVDVVFDGALPTGDTAYFALTNLPSPNNACVTNSTGGCIAVNEPASLFLFGSGLLAIVVMRRRWLAPRSRGRWIRWE